tara:strand:- start:8162 stop:8764 length:603 start_codon:yes stop_codon:yes gene_type:complete
MVSKSNNNIILLVLIFFIIIILFLNYNSCKKNNENDNNDNDNNECTTCTENFVDTPSMNSRKPKIKFNKTNGVKYFDKTDSPSEISNIPVEKEDTIEEFDYDINLVNNDGNLKINSDSTKLVSFDEINDNDQVSVKFNKLIGNVESDITLDNLNLIQGTESQDKPFELKTQDIYNNYLNNDTITNNNKYKPFSGNNYRSI